MKIKFAKMGINGEGIGYISRKPVFCQGVLPGETAEIRITEKKEKYCRAEVIEITEPAKMRRRPVCRHQNECGSCPLMVMDYPWQLKYKKELLNTVMSKGTLSGMSKPLRIFSAGGTSANSPYRNQAAS